MIKGYYVGHEGPAVLKEGITYFLFPNGETHFYVSRFNNQGAHLGCFQKKYFVEVSAEENDWPAEPLPKNTQLQKGMIYQATLIWRRKGYKSVNLQDYFIKPGHTHANFYTDSSLKDCKGCFPMHWFDHFILIGEPPSLEVEPELEKSEAEFTEMENGQLSFF